MRYRWFACLMGLETLALALLVVAGYFSENRMAPVRRGNQELVQVFALTDLSIWTGARYTRHLSQADLFSAFQDSLGALEHFPAGALTPLPEWTKPPEPAPAADTAAFSEADDEPAS